MWNAFDKLVHISNTLLEYPGETGIYNANIK